MQSVELLLDAVTDATVRRHWQALSDAGLPSQGDIPEQTNRPHVTLGVAQHFPGTVERELPALAASLPVPVSLGALIVFGSRRYIVARQVVVTAELLALQAAAANLIERYFPLLDHLAPGHWTPHVTLARRLDPEQVGRALTALGVMDEMAGSSDRLRRWDGQARAEWLLG